MWCSWIRPSTAGCGTVWLDEYAQCLLLPEAVQKANKMNTSHINTSSVTKYTKEEDGGLDGNCLSEAKGASKFPLPLAKIFFAKKKTKPKICVLRINSALL